MLKNDNHNLIHQLSEISDSAWRMNRYIDDTDCGSCRSVWLGLLSDYERHIEMLKEEIESHIAENRFE
jgi:hypothetical protein